MYVLERCYWNGSCSSNNLALSIQKLTKDKRQVGKLTFNLQASCPVTAVKLPVPEARPHPFQTGVAVSHASTVSLCPQTPASVNINTTVMQKQQTLF